MELLYVAQLDKRGNTKHALVCPLGHRDGRLCVIKTKQVPPGEIRRIRANQQRLEQLELPRKLQWIKEHCPVAYKQGYRELGNYQVISRHPIT